MAKVSMEKVLVTHEGAPWLNGELTSCWCVTKIWLRPHEIWFSSSAIVVIFSFLWVINSNVNVVQKSYKPFFSDFYLCKLYMNLSSAVCWKHFTSIESFDSIFQKENVERRNLMIGLELTTLEKIESAWSMTQLGRSKYKNHLMHLSTANS